jgi:LytS/YehU family sensor histidine kinase
MKENKTAGAMVSRLSDFLRYSLDKDPIKRVPLKQEIQALELYLEIEKVRFEDRLQVNWDIQSKASKALVPSLILQPLIENSIKYAISKLQEGGQISISASTFGDDLILEVSDNGPICNISTGELFRTNGVGLTNIRERLQSLYTDNFSFVIAQNKPSGIKVTIRIPHELSELSIED